MQTLQPEAKTAVRQVLSVDDVAEHFDVSGRTIWRWVADGEFPQPLRIGRRLRYWDAGQIDNWIAEGCPEVAK